MPDVEFDNIFLVPYPATTVIIVGTDHIHDTKTTGFNVVFLVVSVIRPRHMIEQLAFVLVPMTVVFCSTNF